MASRTRRIVLQAFAISLAFWIGMLERYINFGGIQVGLYVMPIFVICDLYGFRYGAECALCYDIVKTLFFSKAGVLGFINRIPVIFYMMFRKKKNEKINKVILFDLIGISIYLILKIPISYVFWKTNSNIENLNLINLIITCILPFNLASISSVVLISRFIDLKRFKFVRSYLEI